MAICEFQEAPKRSICCLRVKQKYLLTYFKYRLFRLGNKNKFIQFFLLQIEGTQHKFANVKFFVIPGIRSHNLLTRRLFGIGHFQPPGSSASHSLQFFFSFQVCHLNSAKVPEVDCKRPKNHKTLETDHLSGRVLNFLAKRIGNFVTALQSTNAKSKPIETGKYFFFVFLEYCGG